MIDNTPSGHRRLWMLAALGAGLVLAPLGWAADGASTPAEGAFASGAKTPSGHTFISSPSDLERVLDGRPPRSLEELRQLEQQQRSVARAARACTVNVQLRTARNAMAQGSGVIISEDGYVLTAAHVAMHPGLTATLTLPDGRTVQAETLGMNRGVDAGLMKITDEPDPDDPWPYATLGSDVRLRSGTWCLAIGHPGGYDEERGAVVRAGRVLSISDEAIVTDCALIGGDSGGPLFDLSGRLIAIHSRIGNDVADNIHVPVARYDESWDRLDSGEAWGFLPGFRPVIGVQGSRQSERAEVAGVQRGSPADRAGIQTGDVIVRFGDRDVENFEQLQEAVSDTMPGERISVVVERDGETLDMRLRVGRDGDG